MAKVKLGNVKGSKGDKGDRGSLWRVTDKMTGQSTSDTAFPGANIEDSAVGDMCLNPITCDIYKCTAGGDAANAKWVWVMNNRGPQGPAGPKGDPTTVDAVLSKDSANPIQNKAVATKFQDVQDSLDHALAFRGTLNSGNADYLEPGIYLVGSDNVSNLPAHSSYYILIDFGGVMGGCNGQVMFNGFNDMKMRGLGGGSWSDWKTIATA